MNVARRLFRLLLGSRLPITRGTIQVTGVRQVVTIRRDAYGIPYIEAQSDADAWYGLGFCHGQDRAFQLDVLRRLVRGTLAELVGPRALAVDRLSRRIAFADAAERQMEVLDESTRDMLEAYARGTTDGATLGCPRPAHEFTLLGSRPTRHRAADALGVLKLMSFTLASNWDCELTRLLILTLDGAEALEALDAVYPDWLPVTAPPMTPAGAAVNQLAEDMAAFASVGGRGGASNNWVIDSSRTATRRPILANDPHLGPAAPPQWYLAHVRTPEWAVAGASFVGVPGFPAGHNGTAAWGITAGLVDNTDLFVEEIGPDSRSVRLGDGFVPCEIRREEIRVKGQQSVVEDVLVTPRGPVIGPALNGEVGAISLRATWLDPAPIGGLFCLHRARSVDEFRRSCRQWPALALNIVYADSSGTVGWQLVGDAPRRRKGRGAIPLPGCDPEAGWMDGRVGFDDMPHLVNPHTGFLATANNPPTPQGSGACLSVDWLDGYRLARITEALASRDDWDLASAQALQMDQLSLPWRELRDIVLAIAPDTDDARAALELLTTWDGIVDAASPAASVFEYFLAEMVQRIVRAKGPRAAEWALGKGFTPLVPHAMIAVRRVGHLVRLVRTQPEGWFDRSWPEEMADALACAVRALRTRRGDTADQWAWGHIRPVTLRHVLGDQRPLDRVFNLGPFAWGGDTNTIAQAATDCLEPTANPFFIASLRMVIDVGNWDENRLSLPGGQSGNPCSPHYADLLELWRRGEGVSIAWSPAVIERNTRAVLRLEPRASD